MSAQRFAGRRAVVTGAGSGIGRATARRLLAEGAEVLGVDRDDEGLAETFAGLERAHRHVGDVAEAATADAIRSHGAVDVLVNAAGILRRHQVLEHPRGDWDTTLDVNLKAAWRLCRDFARDHVRRNAPGAIVNVCSIESFTAAPAHIAYTASKSALLMLTRAFALELAPHGVRVNGIAPGVTATGMNAGLRADPDGSDALLRAIPLGRFGRPDDQAAAICFLASDEAGYITGSVVPVDGGWLTR